MHGHAQRPSALLSVLRTGSVDSGGPPLGVSALGAKPLWQLLRWDADQLRRYKRMPCFPPLAATKACSEVWVTLDQQCICVIKLKMQMPHSHFLLQSRSVAAGTQYLLGQLFWVLGASSEQCLGVVHNSVGTVWAAFPPWLVQHACWVKLRVCQVVSVLDYLEMTKYLTAQGSCHLHVCCPN
jgi:hypothetical protein